MEKQPLQYNLQGMAAKEMLEAIDDHYLVLSSVESIALKKNLTKHDRLVTAAS